MIVGQGLGYDKVMINYFVGSNFTFFVMDLSHQVKSSMQQQNTIPITEFKFLNLLFNESQSRLMEIKLNYT